MPEPYRFQSDREKKGFRFDPSFTWGNIGCVITIIFSVSVAYEKLEGRTTTNDAQIGELKQSVSALNSTLVETNLAVRELRTTVQLEGAKTRSENRQDRQ